MSALRSKKKYFIAVLFPLIALWGMPSLYATDKEPVTPNNAKDQLLVHGYVKEATDQYTPPAIIGRIRQYYTLTPYREIKYLSHQKLGRNQHIHLYPSSKEYYCYVETGTQRLVFQPYDAKGTSTKQCPSPFEGTIVTMQDIGDNNLIIIATAKPELVLFDPAKACIVRQFKLDKFTIKDPASHFPDNIYPLGPYSFITTLGDSEIWTYWDTRKEDPIQGDTIANSVIVYVAPMPASQHILICYDVIFKEKTSAKYGLYDLKTSSFVALGTFKKALPLLRHMYSETKGSSLLIMTPTYKPGSVHLLEIHPQKNGYSFVEKPYSLPHNLGPYCIQAILIPFPSSKLQMLVHTSRSVKLYTIISQEAYQLVATLDVSSFAIGNAPCIKKVNNTVVIYGQSGIISFALS